MLGPKYVFRLQTYLQFTRVGLRAFLLESIESVNMGKLMFNFFVWPETYLEAKTCKHTI